MILRGLSPRKIIQLSKVLPNYYGFLIEQAIRALLEMLGFEQANAPDPPIQFSQR